MPEWGYPAWPRDPKSSGLRATQWATPSCPPNSRNYSIPDGKKLAIEILLNGNIIRACPEKSLRLTSSPQLPNRDGGRSWICLPAVAAWPLGAIVLALGLRQPSVTKHLGVLRKAGLVCVNKQGRQRIYELRLDPLRPVYDWVKTFEQHWDRHLDRIQARAEQRAFVSSSASYRTDLKKGAL
jgi:DNA-binding transcriptional ArsR family regulator